MEALLKHTVGYPEPHALSECPPPPPPPSKLWYVRREKEGGGGVGCNRLWNTPPPFFRYKWRHTEEGWPVKQMGRMHYNYKSELLAPVAKVLRPWRLMGKKSFCSPSALVVNSQHSALGSRLERPPRNGVVPTRPLPHQDGSRGRRGEQPGIPKQV